VLTRLIAGFRLYRFCVCSILIAQRHIEPSDFRLKVRERKARGDGREVQEAGRILQDIIIKDSEDPEDGAPR
jgi:hypothetical protein